MRSSQEEARHFYTLLRARRMKRLSARFCRSSESFKAIKSFITKEDRILDLGCGYGRMTIPLFAKGYHVDGLDLSPNLIKFAKEWAEARDFSIRFTLGDMCQLPYEKNSYDKIICLWNCFNHLLEKKNQVKALKEVHRILKPGGLAFFEMLNAESKLKQRAYKDTWPIRTFEHENTKVTLYCHTRHDLEKLLTQIGITSYKIGFKNISGTRRIVMVFYK